VVEENKIRIGRCGYSGDFIQFAVPNQCRCIRPRTPLNKSGDDLGTSASRQFLKLRQRCLEVQIRVL